MSPATPSALRVAPLAVCALAALSWALFISASPAVAQAPSPQQERIAKGVHAAGIDVGGLTLAQATALLERRLGTLALRPVAVYAAGRKFRLDRNRAKLAFDPLRTAKRALYAGRKLSGAPAQGQPTEGGGAKPKPLADVPAAVTYSRRAVFDLARRVRRGVQRRPRSARLRIGIRKLSRRRARIGIRLDAAKVARRIEARLADPAASRHIRQKVKKVRPAVTDRGLVKRYPVVLTIDRHNFKLRLFKRLRWKRTYGIALGAAGYDTPAGLFKIANKQVNPAWTAPNKPWAGAYAGRTVPGGRSDNPLKARWLGIRNGVGIHGTSAEWSIGTRASHGCIRMRVADVKRLYRHVPVGTPIRISR